MRCGVSPASESEDSGDYIEATTSALVGANVDGDDSRRDSVLAVHENMADCAGLCAKVGNLGAGSRVGRGNAPEVNQAEASNFSGTEVPRWHLSSSQVLTLFTCTSPIPASSPSCKGDILIFVAPSSVPRCYQPRPRTRLESLKATPDFFARWDHPLNTCRHSFSTTPLARELQPFTLRLASLLQA